MELYPEDWKKAIVHKVHPSQDNLVRSVTIRDSDGSDLDFHLTIKLTIILWG